MRNSFCCLGGELHVKCSKLRMGVGARNFDIPRENNFHIGGGVERFCFFLFNFFFYRVTEPNTQLFVGDQQMSVM